MQSLIVMQKRLKVLTRFCLNANTHVWLNSGGGKKKNMKF